MQEDRWPSPKLTMSQPFTGWIVTYVIDLRGGGPSAGYISSGFFGGTPTTHVQSCMVT